jgi:hypothetical protein
MGMSSVVATISTEVKWSVQNNLVGSAYNPVQNAGDIRKNYSFGTAAGNTVTGGGDEVFSFQQGIAAGASATLDLTTMTNLLLEASVSIARIKGWQVRVLSTEDDSTLSPAPTATSKVTVTNNGPTLPNPLDFTTGGSSLTLALTTGAGVITNVAIGAAGTGYLKSASFLVAPNQAGGSGGVISVTTNASGVPTAVAVVAGGTGYSNATVPSTDLGQYTILTGGAHMYFDPAANGFAAVDSTHKNVKFQNNDGTNAVTLEIDIFAATS